MRVKNRESREAYVIPAAAGKGRAPFFFFRTAITVTIARKKIYLVGQVKSPKIKAA